MKILYYIYQLFIAFPLYLVLLLVTSFITVLGCVLGDGDFWGYWPGKLWGQAICRLFLLPVKVEGRENLKEGQSYVFVANHQGAMDIYLIYGFLGRKFKWMMKESLRRVPFIGMACEKAHHVFVDHSGPSKIKRSIETARGVLKDGMSLVVFPEGTRTSTGKVGNFKRGAFLLADGLQLPVVPLTIVGSYEILPRQRGMFNFLRWHHLKLIIHEPIMPEGKGDADINETMRKAREAVCSGLMA